MHFNRHSITALAFALSLLAVSCRGSSKDPLVTVAEKYNAGKFVSLGDYYQETAGVKLSIKGVVIEVDQADVSVILDAIRSDYVNVMPFRIEKNYGHGGKKDRVAIVKTIDQFQLITALHTQGKEDKVSTASVVAGLKAINALAKIKIIGAGADFVEFTFADTPSDLGKVAAACAQVAPNIVTYGTGSIEKLEGEIARYNGAILWWY